MPRVKTDEFDDIVRNYKVKCKNCGKMTFITTEEPDCDYCEQVHCPDCLTLMADGNHTVNHGSSEYGSWYRVTCKKCMFDVIDEDLPFGFNLFPIKINDFEDHE